MIVLLVNEVNLNVIFDNYEYKIETINPNVLAGMSLNYKNIYSDLHNYIQVLHNILIYIFKKYSQIPYSK